MVCRELFISGTDAVHSMATVDTNGDLYPLADVAREAGVHPRTLLRWAEAGKIPKPRKLKANGRRVYTAHDRATIIGFSKATISD